MRKYGRVCYQVSEAIGFTDAPYFNRYFKRLTGLTPGEYQKR
jgi:AraC-like DNA-binding protein